MASPIRIGVIGCGLQGHALIDSINHLEAPFRPAVTALCDPWPLARKSALELIARGTGTPVAALPTAEFAEITDEFCEKTDAVLIASPDYLHESQALKCISQGLHVYLEPPMALSAAGARSLVEASVTERVQLQIGYHRRSHPNYQFALGEELRADIFGWLNIVKTYFALPLPTVQLANLDPDLAVPSATLESLGFKNMDAFIGWRDSQRCYAGWLRNEVSHQIDASNWALGRPRATVGAGTCVFSKSGHLDSVDSALEFPTTNGKVARAVNHLQIGHSLPGVADVFHGTETTVTIDESRGIAFLCPETNADLRKLESPDKLGRHFEKRGRPVGLPEKEYWRQLNSAPRIFACVGGGTPPPTDNSRYLKAPFSRPLFRAHLDNFLQAIERTSRGAPPALHCSGPVGHNTTLTCLGIEEAVTGKQRIQFDPKAWLDPS